MRIQRGLSYVLWMALLITTVSFAGCGKASGTQNAAESTEIAAEISNTKESEEKAADREAADLHEGRLGGSHLSGLHPHSIR